VLESLLDSITQEEKQAEKHKKSTANPLFAKPQNTQQSAPKKVEKKRIRV